MTRYVHRVEGLSARWLRETSLPDAPPAPALGARFAALGGAVREADGVLTAFGHSFVGGTWAALRDVPLRGEDGTLNWDTVLILHASDTTVTAVRQDGSVQACPRGLFETEILRVPAGAFQGFGPVGMLSNTWPAHWAWARCAADTRAVVVHEAWRDNDKRGAPQGSPPHWTWKERPGKRPARLPPSAPVAPLRLTLADVTGEVLHDEPLARATPPLLLPLTATVGGRDVRPAVAKRTLYPPAQWPEELDDRTSTAGPLTLTYDLPLRAQAGEGDTILAGALLLRLRLPGRAPTTLEVNGAALPLHRLGHNAATDRGWHPYVIELPTPVTDTYTLTFRGRCSRALLCLRELPAGSA